MTEHAVILRGSPGMRSWSAPGREHRGRTLASQVSLYWHAAADASRDGDTFGLMAALVARGILLLHGILVVPDDCDPATLRAIRRWAATHTIDTPTGPAPWRVVTLREFFDPFATREATDEKDAKPWAFVPNAYNRGAGPIVGADQGRIVGLVAEHVEVRTGRSAGSWQAWLPGWGTPRPEHGDIGRVSPHRPPLWVTPRRKGWTVRFAPCEKGFGTRPAPFLDLLSAAYAMDADRSGGFVDHARHFRITAEPLPVTVSLDATGADRIAEAVRSVHALALQVDDESSRWLISPQDRAEWVARFPLPYAHSPAGLADHLLRRFRVAPPLGHFALSEREHAMWWEAFHGGWCDDEPGIRRHPFDAVVLDVTSAYPLTAHLIGWWDVMTANRLVRRSVLRELRALCRRAMEDPAAVLDPAVWARFGLTVCEVVPDGERFPVALDDPKRPDGRTETVAVSARGRSLFYAWPDVVAAAILSGRVPHILSATRLVPEGHQDGLRKRIAVYPGLVLDADQDPVLGLVRRRRQAKAEGDKDLAAGLHAMVNSLVSGNFERLDDVRRKRDGRWRTEEKAGPWTFAPIGATVTAGARLLLAVAGRMARDRGSRVLYRDTDSSLLPVASGGDTITLADGSTVRALTEAEIDGILGAFAPLSPEPDWPVWKAEGPMRAVVFGAKRHAEWRGNDDAPQLVDWTEAGLGGMWADPPAMQGRGVDGGQAWSKAAVVREVRYAAAKLARPNHATRDAALWDAPTGPAFPTLRRLAVTSPRLLDTLPKALGAHLGSRYVEGVTRGALRPSQPAAVVALDPGGPLDGWRELPWVDRSTGSPVDVTTDAEDFSAVLLEPLALRAGYFSDPPRAEPVESVVVTPLSVVSRGRVSPVLDAAEDGLPDPASARVRYEDAHGLGPGQRDALAAHARSMPSRDFAELAGVTPRIARQITRGELPRRRTVERILAELRRDGVAWQVPSAQVCRCGCGRPVPVGRRGYFSDAHRETAKKRRARATRSPAPGGTGSEKQPTTTTTRKEGP